MAPPSRRISVATIRSGSVSQLRATTYTYSSSNRNQISVFSLAGAPSRGSCWTKSLIAGTTAYTASSSRPSICSGVETRTARMVTRPDSSLAITAGDSGGGGPSTAIGDGCTAEGCVRTVGCCASAVIVQPSTKRHVVTRRENIEARRGNATGPIRDRGSTCTSFKSRPFLSSLGTPSFVGLSRPVHPQPAPWPTPATCRRRLSRVWARLRAPAAARSADFFCGRYRERAKTLSRSGSTSGAIGPKCVLRPPSPRSGPWFRPWNRPVCPGASRSAAEACRYRAASPGRVQASAQLRHRYP